MTRPITTDLIRSRVNRENRVRSVIKDNNKIITTTMITITDKDDDDDDDDDR